MNIYKNLAKDSFIYGLGGGFANAITFLILPIYTRIFSPKEFGTIEMLSIISLFLGTIFTMGLDSAQSMYFFKTKVRGIKEQSKVISSIFQFRIIWGFFIIIISTLASPILNKFFFNGELDIRYFLLAFLSAFFSQILSQSIEVARLTYKPLNFVFLSLSRNILVAFFIIFFSYFLNLNIYGYFAGLCLGSFIVSIVGWFQIKNYWLFNKLHFNLWKKLLFFGVPLITTGIFEYFISSSDRWFIQYYVDQSELGIYAVGAKFSLVTILIVETFRKAWWPYALENLENPNSKNIYRRIGTIYIGLSSIGVMLLTLLSPILVRIFAGPDFYDAWRLVGLLSWKTVFYGCMLIVSLGLWKENKTYLNLPIIILSSIVGIVLNFILVPSLGGEGASIATSITYAFWVILSMKISSKYWNINFEKIKIILQLSIALFATFWLIYNRSVFNEWFNTLLFFLFSFIILLITFKKSDINQIKKLIKTKFFKKIKNVN